MTAHTGRRPLARMLSMLAGATEAPRASFYVVCFWPAFEVGTCRVCLSETFTQALNSRPVPPARGASSTCRRQAACRDQPHNLSDESKHWRCIFDPAECLKLKEAWKMKPKSNNHPRPLSHRVNQNFQSIAQHCNNQNRKY